MAQIGFTHKSEHIYDRFEKLRSDYAREHGRTYAPGFLTVLMDAFEVIGRLETVMELDSTKPVSLRSYIADAEANDPNLQPVNETKW